MRKLRFGLFAGLAGIGAAALLAGVLQVSGGQPAMAGNGAPTVPDKIDYNFDVRPILSDKCFSCHGHDPGTRKASLRLDTSEDAYAKMPEDPRKRAVVPGNPNKSELLRRVLATDPELRMPPASRHQTLSPYEVAVLTKWIKQGAHYEKHWAYIVPTEVKFGSTPWDAKAVNPVDRYVYDRIAKAGFAPSPEADRETLINRVTLDLTGLPPTLADVDAFVNDKSANAYEKVVDRLLTSNAYAERMAMSWMDVARYGDTDGYLNDPDGRFQFPYRDWVIAAYKRNLPYDQFVTWQLAGDKLPNATREQILATAFVRMNKKSNENGIIDEEYRVEYVNERSELIGKVFLGLTVGCAKCHDHKYDAISNADYYSLGGFFNSLDEHGVAQGEFGPTLDWPTPLQAKTLAAAKQTTVAKEAVYRAVLAQAEHDAAARAPKQTAQIGGLLQASLDQSQQAYYPFENYYKDSFEALMINPADQAAGGRYAALRALVPGGAANAPVRDKSGVMKLAPVAAKGGPPHMGPPHAGPPHMAMGMGKPGLIKASIPASAKMGAHPGAKPGASGPMAGPGPAPAGPKPDPTRPRVAQDELNRAIGEHLAAGLPLDVPDGSIRKRQLFVGLKEPVLFWTPSGVAGGKPGVMNHGTPVPGPAGHGMGVMVDDTIGFADKDVGKFERTDPFTLDLWVKLRADKEYDKANILFNGAAYAIGVDHNALTWGIVHSGPYNQINIQTVAPVAKGKWIHVTATYDGSSRAAGLKLYGDGKLLTTQVMHDNLTLSSFPRGGHTQFGSYTGLSIGRIFGVPEFNKGAVDELRVFTRALTPVEVAYLHDKKALASAKSDVVQAGVDTILAEKDPRVMKAEAEWKAAVMAQQAAEAPIKKIDVAGDQMTVRPTYLLDRGNYDQHKQELPVQALPQIFPYGSQYAKNRLGLTQWLFDPKNPLTARVYVNRLWQTHFGTGIVETMEDFGTQGSSPTNLPLLDYLSVEFQRSGWDVRRIQKLIVMSATYRQTSNISPVMAEKDGKNLYLARGPRFRLQAETIRDNALVASGLLSPKIGGDAVFPYQPDGVWKSMGTGPNIYPTQVPDDEMHRRSMYTYIKRNAQFPSLSVFDLPDRNVSAVSRKISNTPLQALVMLNDPQFMEAYRKLAERAIKLAPGNADQQDIAMFRLATRRRPMDKELAVMRQYRAAETAHMQADPDAVKKLLTIGVAKADPTLDPVQVAAMTMTTAVVMNSPDAYSLR